jgi:hypothetical protein
MSGRLIVIFLVLTCVAASFAHAQVVTQFPSLSTEQLFERVSGSVCTIISIDEEDNLVRRGSGFILKNSRLLVTNAHVLAGFEKAEVKCGDQIARVEGITNYDGEIDLVLAKTGQLDVVGLELATRPEIRPGTQVYAFGSPYGLEGTITPGLTSTSREIMGQRYHSTGAVIGVTVATLEIAQNINFALPASAIRRLPSVDLQPAELLTRERQARPRQRSAPSALPETETDIASGGGEFRGFAFGSSCGDIARSEYERKLASSRRKGLTRFNDRYSGTLEIAVDLAGIPATVFYTCHERFGMVRGHYEILGHYDTVPKIADELSGTYGAGFSNPISETEASELGCRWNFSLPGSRHYRPSERTTWNIDENLRIDMIVCGGTSNMTFVIYGDPLLGNLVDQVEEPKIIM